MKIYNYDHETGEFLSERGARVLPGRGSLPDDDPSKWQVPAHATVVAPPAVENGRCARWTGDGWETVADHRGETWWLARGVSVVIDRIGDPATFEPPLSASEPPPSDVEVNAERDRRIAAFTFGGHAYDLDSESQANVSGAGLLALSAIIEGAQPGDLRWSDADHDFVWIAADNSRVTMDAQTVWAFAQAAAEWKRDHIYAARSIKDLSPIPTDYADDARWPQA